MYHSLVIPRHIVAAYWQCRLVSCYTYHVPCLDSCVVSWLALARYIEEILNKAWSSATKPGKWVSYDEQMVKVTSTYASQLRRFNEDKPIKHGTLKASSKVEYPDPLKV